MIVVVPSCWRSSQICQEAEAERARKDAELAKEAERVRRRNRKIWERCGAAVPVSVTNCRALGTGRNAKSPESVERRLTRDTIRYRLVRLLLGEPKTARELAGVTGIERHKIALHLNQLRIAAFVRYAGWAEPEPGSTLALRRYEATKNGRKEVHEAANRKACGRGRRMAA